MGALPNPVRKENNAIEIATSRLSAALEALEQAIEERRETDVRVEGHAARIQAFGLDRSRLADELDRTQAHGQALERVNREVAARIDGVMGTIRRVLGPEASE